MRIFSYLLFVVVLLTAASCKSSERATIAHGAGSYQSLAEQKYGRGVDFFLNSSGTAVLCVRRTKPAQLQPQQQVSFFVFDIRTESVLYEDNVPNGSVKWRDDTSVVVLVTPGIVRDDGKESHTRSGYVLDLRTRRTRDIENADVQ